MRLLRVPFVVLTALAVLWPSARAVSAGAGAKATVTYLKGVARIQAGKAADFKNATLGATLGEGDTIITLENTRLELKLESGQVIRLGPSTKFTLTTFQKTPLGGVRGFFSVVTGRLWFTVSKMTSDSEIRTQTPSVVAAVKGTVFRVDTADNGQSNVAVYDGTVTAQREGQEPVAIGKMEQLVAMPNAAFEKGTVDDAADDKDDFIRWNKNRDKLRVMIILPETHGTEKAEASVAENAAIKRFLNNYLFTVVDKQQVDQIRETEKVKAALKGDATAAAAAGLEVAADLIIIGKSTAQYFKSPALGGLISASTNLTAKAVRADTAEVVASQPGITKRGVDITDEAAAQKSCMAAGEAMASEFVDSILANWRREVRKGTALNVSVDGVKNSRNLTALKNALAGLAGVKEVESLYFVGRRALLNVTYSGDSGSLAEAIEKADFGAQKVDVVGVSAYKLELEIVGGVGPSPAPAKAPPAEAAPAAAPAASAPAASAP